MSALPTVLQRVLHMPFELYFNPYEQQTVSYLRIYTLAPAGVTQWIEHRPVSQVTGLIPNRAHAWLVGQVSSLQETAE